jgi:hypothetical protein
MQDPTQRARIMQRLSEFAQHLDDDGYAIVRTPWPYEDRDEEGARTTVSLETEGLEGPETHAYGSTAVHWYMKA